MKLYELTGCYQQLQELLESGEISEQTFNDTLECLNDEMEVKAENIAKIIRIADGDIEAIKAEEKRLADKRRTIENRKESLKKYLESNFITAGITKLKTALFSFGIQKNPPSVNVVEEVEIPEEFWVPQPDQLNKKAILEKLKSGEVISGCELKQTESLRIR